MGCQYHVCGPRLGAPLSDRARGRFLVSSSRAPSRFRHLQAHRNSKIDPVAILITIQELLAVRRGQGMRRNPQRQQGCSSLQEERAEP
jgi:hypothetical protein